VSVATGPRGEFLLPDVGEVRRSWIEATHAGFESSAPTPVSIPAEEDVIIRMNPAPAAGRLAGAVTDTNQKPIGGAVISLLDSTNRTIAETQAGAGGLYEFGKVAEGSYVVVCAAEGYLDTRAGPGYAAIAAGKEARLDFTLEAGRQIHGQVITSGGDPVFQARIVYFPEDARRGRQAAPGKADPGARRGSPRGASQGTPAAKIATTDTLGRFQLTGLPDLVYQLLVSHRDYPSLSSQARPSTDPLVLTLDPGLSLRGTITDAQGAALERIELTLQSRSREAPYNFITTDGHFEIRGLARDTYQVVLQSGRARYSGALELQSSAEIFITLGSGRGGRGMSPLNILRIR
jgi:hypothetical protein